jgi:tRNA threonylcarbamoyladenosine biosynthesis protein TsaE
MQMNRFCFLAKSEEDTRRLGRALAEVLPAGTTVALVGTLGAGKTRLVQAVAEACGVPSDAVVSPTFVLCQEYHGHRPVYHMDAYRLRDTDEFQGLGPEEYFESDGITLVEWADRVIDCLPLDRIEIHIEVAGQTAREFGITAIGEGLSAVPMNLDHAMRV